MTSRTVGQPGPTTTPSPPALERPGRVVIEGVTPEIDRGRFPIKRVVGETVVVEADIFTEGHDRMAAVLCHRPAGAQEWSETPMESLGNDRWRASFAVTALGRYEYAVEAWIDRFASWRAGLEKKVTAGVDVSSELLEGALLVEETADRAWGGDAGWLRTRAAELRRNGDAAARTALALDPDLAGRVAAAPDRGRSTRYAPGLMVQVERELARFGAWYEFFPRSASPAPGRHGTLRDCEARLPYIAAMGFDVVYFPPIHPIGLTHRKGPNNNPQSGPDDVGSPWGIGAREGGHQAVHPALGTLEDFDRLVASARTHGLEIALDIAFQCSPDHPYAKDHPEWFRHRPDGTIQYAENPPKKYQDIYPIDFESDDWRALWQELLDVVRFWVGHGVTIFRVDNPHTKPFAFWEWLIAEVRREHPETIFLSEAFTRPKVLRYLAKSGFAQSYTYFTWRNTKGELTEYITELTDPEVRQYLRPNFFANTPDILHEYLQVGGKPAHQIRVILAATLAANYGIYGPPFELAEARAVPGTEEYQDSEKYQLRHWDLSAADGIQPLITRLNAIRRAHAAFRDDTRTRFVPVDNESLIAYLRTTPELDDIVLVVVNLDPHHPQAGWVELPLEELGMTDPAPYQVHDLLSEARYLWHGARNFVALDPAAMPAHVFRLRRRIKTERDFDYYL